MVITVSAALVTIVWFVRDTGRENGRVLKTILDAQKTAFEIQREESEILAKIEEGQRRGFETLAQILVKIGVK